MNGNSKPKYQPNRLVRNLEIKKQKLLRILTKYPMDCNKKSYKVIVNKIKQAKMNFTSCLEKKDY